MLRTRKQLSSVDARRSDANGRSVRFGRSKRSNEGCPSSKRRRPSCRPNAKKLRHCVRRNWEAVERRRRNTSATWKSTLSAKKRNCRRRRRPLRPIVNGRHARRLRN